MTSRRSFLASLIGACAIPKNLLHWPAPRVLEKVAERFDYDKLLSATLVQYEKSVVDFVTKEDVFFRYITEGRMMPPGAS